MISFGCQVLKNISKNSNSHCASCEQKSQKFVGHNIARDRYLQSIQNLVDNSPKAEFYFSDAFSVYSQICYEGVYRALNNKSQTFNFEFVNYYIYIFIF